MSAPAAGDDDRRLPQTDLEIQESHRQAERRAGRKADGAASDTPALSGDTVDTSSPAEFSLVDGDSNAGRPTDSAKNEADFFARVVAWPLPGQRGFVNVHWFTPEKHVGGRPFTQLNEFMSFIEWAKNHPNVAKEVYFCTSLQSETAPAFDGKKPRALRNADNAIGGKSIFIDVDIKESPKGYANRNEAFDAIQAFLPAAKLPPLSALVDSGGGFHLYWISDRVLGMDEWQTYANGLRNLAERHGLRCDLGVTIDRARILRVPGTVNRKTGTPRPVKLLALASRDINFESALSQIRSAGPVRATASRQTARNLVLFDAPTRPPITDSDYIAECGVSQSYDDNLDPRPLVAHNGCPFLQETFRTGGKDQDQGLWMMTGLLTTFLSGGRAIFHEMSKGYKTYDPGETDKMFDRKAEEREEKDLGWPSCQTFQQYGSKQCATCQHLAKRKSPLHLTGPVGVAPISRAMEDKWPDGVDHNTGLPRKGILNTIEAIKRAGITCSYDEFRQKEYWQGHADKSFDGELSDAAVTVTRVNIRTKFRLYPKVEETREAITFACHANKTNPVLDYFAKLKWDGTPRLDKTLHRYLVAADSRLNEAISRKVICAIVRRAKQPGCKFDHQLVLQSPQGRKKSMFCEDLAVFPDLYTDAGDLSGTIKEQMEIIQGMQIIEFPELAGYGRATRERNKASLSRKKDRARLSYAHYATNQPRQSIPIATTNEDHYLNDPTGERRYWHVAVKLYDRDAFLADKHQIYAEAVAREPAENLWLDTPKLEAAHDAVVATIKAPNELVDILADLHGEVWHVNGKDEERVSTSRIRDELGMTEADAIRAHNIGQRIEDAMKTLGWTKAPATIRCRRGHSSTTGYTRPMPLGPPYPPRPSHGQGPPVDVGEAEDSDVEMQERILPLLQEQAMNAQSEFAQAQVDIAQAQADLARMKGNS